MMSWAKRAWHELSEDRVTDMAAGLAYRFMLALFPFFIFLASFSGFISRAIGVEDPSGRIVDSLSQALPSDARSVFGAQLQSVLGSSRPGLLSVGLIGALWSASSGLAAAMRAMNVAYDVDEGRPWWRRALLSLSLTIVGGLALIGAFIALVGVQLAQERIVQALGDGQAVTIAITITRYVAAVLLITVATAVMYWLLPNAHLRFRWLSWGAALFVVSWIAATLGFGWYVSNFGSYNATYGALGGAVVLMIWLYVTALVLLVGAEVNAMIARAERAPVGQPASRAASASPNGTDPSAGRAADEQGEPQPHEGRVARPGTAAAVAGAVVGVTALGRALSSLAATPRHRDRRPAARREGEVRRESRFEKEGVSHG